MSFNFSPRDLIDGKSDKFDAIDFAKCSGTNGDDEPDILDMGDIEVDLDDSATAKEALAADGRLDLTAALEKGHPMDTDVVVNGVPWQA